MVRAGMAQDGDSVVPFTMWVFAVPSTLLLQKEDNISLWCSSTSVSEGLVSEVLVEGRRPARYFLYVCASLRLLVRTKIFNCPS